MNELKKETEKAEGMKVADRRRLSSGCRPRRIGRALALRHAAACLSFTARLSSLGFWRRLNLSRDSPQPTHPENGPFSRVVGQSTILATCLRGNIYNTTISIYFKV